LAWLKRETDVWLEVTTLLIPGQNDSEAEVGRLCDWFVEHLGAETPLHLTAFHPDFKLTDVSRTPAATLQRARRQAQGAGLKHVYTGNVHDVAGGSTYCAGCGDLLVERGWYRLGAWNLDDGRCPRCHQALAGHVCEPPGTWGPKRMRVLV
jgi:pyruvate formate lyase activating enzyme